MQLHIGHGKVNQWNQLCAEVQITHIGKVLMDVDECDSHSLYEYYLHDFVRMVHSCHHKKPEFSDLEYKVTISNIIFQIKLLLLFLSLPSVGV